MKRFPQWDIRRPEIARRVRDANVGGESVPKLRALAWEWHEVGKSQAALSWCKKVLKARARGDAYSLYLAAICLSELDRPDEAQAMFDTAEKLDFQPEPVLTDIRARAVAQLGDKP